ncbi:unnamed protein product [Cutaneotrichosporon oleaginosum]
MSAEKSHMDGVEPVHTSNFDRRPSKMDFNHLEKVPTNTPEWNDLRDDAMRAEENEKSMGLVEGLRNYPNAVFWSFAISLCIIMEGYDTQVLGNVIGLSEFRQKFGFDTGVEGEGRYQLTAAWQTAISQAPTIGCFIGILISSWAQDKWGYRRTIQIALVFLTGTIFIVFFAVNVEMLFIGELLCGLPWGAFSSSAVSYASDVTPIPLRGYLTTYINLCWVIGQMIGAGILRKVTTLPGANAYRIPFAVQWVWPIPLFILVTLAPESPWFLVRAGRLAEAKRVVERLSRKGEKVDSDATVAMMVRTNQMEIDNETGSTYIDCFKGVDLRRTEIACVVWICQQLCGMVFCGSPTYFFLQAGLAEDNAFSLNLGITGIAFVGTVASWITLTIMGRRPPFLAGMAFMCMLMWIIAGLSWPADKGGGGAWGQAALVMIFVFVYDFTIGPLTYCIVGEVSSTRLRSKTVGLARNAYNVVGVCAGILNTYMVNATEWNLKGRAAFVWGGTSLICTIWCFFRLPEMKGRSYRELDILFERRIPARKFRSTIIDEHEES